MYVFLRAFCFILFMVFFMSTVSIYNYSKETLDIYEIKIKNSVFYPDKLEVPKNKRFFLVINNEDSKPEIFISSNLRLKKILPPFFQVSFIVGALSSGEYEFQRGLNHNQYKGIIVAK